MIQQVLQHYNNEYFLYKKLREYLLAFQTKYTQNLKENFSDKELIAFEQGYQEQLLELRRQELIRNHLIKEVLSLFNLQDFSIRSLKSTDIEPKVIQSLEEVISLLTIELQEITDLHQWIENEINLALEKTKFDIHRLHSAKKLKNAYLVNSEKEPWYIDENE